MNKRLEKIKEYMRETSLDSLVITDRKNMRYISSYTGEGYLVLGDKVNYLVTDSRYTEQAKEQTCGFEVCDIASFKPGDAFGGFAATGFENLTISYQRYDALGGVFAKLVPVGSVFTDLRGVKDEEEIRNIAYAELIGDMAFEHIIDYIKPGVSERDLAAEIEYFMKKSGAESTSFDTIVATGVHSSMPHAEPDERPVAQGFLTLDFGCVYNGYCSDMTRTLCVGKATDQMKDIYNTVLEAQLSSIDMIKSGVTGKEVHLGALDIIDRKYKGTFGHGLGHGVGLDIHEKPGLSLSGDKPLEVNNVVTVEPGIYIPGFGGVRIEDLVVVKDKNVINLTKSPKNLIEI